MGVGNPSAATPGEQAAPIRGCLGTVIVVLDVAMMEARERLARAKR